jgi:hypothetical protein
VLDMCVDYLVPQMKAVGADDAFKYITLQIGSNDLCSACNEAQTGNFLRTHPRLQFEILTLILRKASVLPLQTPSKQISGKSHYKYSRFNCADG